MFSANFDFGMARPLLKVSLNTNQPVSKACCELALQLLIIIY